MADKKPLVLVADDERNAVVLLRHIFERDGFAVESAKDGPSALKMARDLRPDLILMDVQMPKMDGFKVVELLRADPVTARTPIIFVTAAAREATDVAHGLKLGADDYIRKPYNYHELLARAHSKMRARQLEDRLQRRSEELEALVRVGAEFNQRLGLDELADLILLVAVEELGADYAELCLLDNQQQPILFKNSAMGSCDPGQASLLLAERSSAIGWVFGTGEPVLSLPPGDPALVFDYLPSQNTNSVMAVPLYHHGSMVGIYVAGHTQPDHFSDTDLRLMRSVGEQAALAIRNAQLYAELRSYAQNLESMVEKRTEELRHTQAQLIRTEKLAAVGRLAAGIAHEVNNPLQPIMNCLEVAIEDIESGKVVDAEGLRIAEKEVQRIKTIVSQLLDFARPGTTDTSEIDLCDLVQEVLSLTRKQLERMNIDLVANLSQVPVYCGNSSQLKQVVLNLIINAMESMPEGGQLTIDLYTEHDAAVIAVIDTGVGIDSDAVAQIFDPFYSTKDNGTGLGLAVSYGIIEGHGGDIRVKSTPGQGSCFMIILPYFLPSA